jgi:hypothetical protein
MWTAPVPQEFFDGLIGSLASKAQRHGQQSLVVRTEVLETEAFQERRRAGILHGRLL